VLAKIGEGGAGTDDDGVGCDLDEAKLREVPEGDELFGLETASAEGDHELCATGDDGVGVRGAGENLQDRVKRVGGDEVVLDDVGTHGALKMTKSRLESNNNGKN